MRYLIIYYKKLPNFVCVSFISSWSNQTHDQISLLKSLISSLEQLLHLEEEEHDN